MQSELSVEDFVFLKTKIMHLTGLDLDSYKPEQMRRRLAGFLKSQQVSAQQFCRMLENDRDALESLQGFLMINVSEFFRDTEQFRILRAMVLPELLKHNPSLKVWSAGCSHGGETYSLAFLLEDVAPNAGHRIIGTDINETMLERARRGGPYTRRDAAGVHPKYLLKHFEKTADGYWVAPEIREKIVFRKHNLLADPFLMGFDLIVCRNVVIYFTQSAKEKLYKSFRRSLKPNGVLFLGATEMLLDSSQLSLERIHNCFYQKKEFARRTP